MQAIRINRILGVALSVLLVPALTVAQESGNQKTARPGDKLAIIEILNVKERPLRDVVAYIAERSGTNILVEQGVDEPVTIQLTNVEWRHALDIVAEQAKCVVVAKGPNILQVEKPPRVHFAFEKTDIQKVIDLIAKISGANIIVGPEVQGTITLRLKDVPWRNALEEAVKTLNFTVVEEDRGILRVVAPSSLNEQKVAREFQLKYVRPQSPYIPYVKENNYIKGTPKIQTQSQGNDPTKDFTILSSLKRMLTPTGQLEYVERSNVLLVKDIKPVIDEIARMLGTIDVEPGQVLVDVKFVTTTSSDILDVGVSPGDTGWVATASLGQIPHRLPFDLGNGGFEDRIIVNPNGPTGPFADPALNAGSTIIPNTIFGALSFTQVTAALRLLKRDSSTEIVQAPKIIALDHQEATIFVGETIRYAEAEAEQGQAGGLQLSVHEAPGSPVQTGFQLLVTPHIVPGTSKVQMEVIPMSDSLSGTSASPLAPAGFDVFTVGAGAGGVGSIALPRIASSTIATKMLLESGQTAVIGGLSTDTNSETETKIPLLGDIPILGWAFKNRVVSKSRRNLIVFVTPEIVRSPEETKKAIENILNDRRKALQQEYTRIFSQSGG